MGVKDIDMQQNYVDIQIFYFRAWLTYRYGMLRSYVGMYHYNVEMQQQVELQNIMSNVHKLITLSN